MNETVSIVVAALVFMFLGVGLCLLGVFCYFMLKMMKGLQDSAVAVTNAVRESSALALELRDEVRTWMKESMGPGSPLSRGSNAMNRLVESLPEIMQGLAAFSKTMEVFYATAIDQSKVPARTPRRAPAPGPPDDGFTGMIPYSEEVMAQIEVDRKLATERRPVTEEQLSMMNTDRGKDVRLPEEGEPEPVSGA